MHYALRNYKHLSMEESRFLLNEQTQVRVDTLHPNDENYQISSSPTEVSYWEIWDTVAQGYSYCASFDGTQKLTKPVITPPGAGTSRSYALWICPSATGDMGLLDDGPYSLAIEVLGGSPTDSVISYSTRVNGSWWNDATWTYLPISTWQWTHLVASHDGVAGRWALYLNGQQVYEHGWSNRYDDDGACYDFNLGWGSSAGYGPFSGGMAHLRIFNKPLTGQEVNEIYASFQPQNT